MAFHYGVQQTGGKRSRAELAIPHTLPSPVLFTAGVFQYDGNEGHS